MRQLLFCSVMISSLFFISCTTPGEKTAKGAGLGAVGGAVAGAIIGNQSGNAAQGAVIGAMAGAAIGGSVGNYLDKQAKELAEIAETRRTEQGIVTKLKNDLLFESGSASLKPNAVTNIHKISDIIKKYPEDIVAVVGHTDSVGKASFNQKLAEQRANAVRIAMVQRGVPSNNVSVIGMGESQPIASNKTRSGRARNRRVELQISVDESKIKK